MVKTVRTNRLCYCQVLSDLSTTGKAQRASWLAFIRKVQPEERTCAFWGEVENEFGTEKCNQIDTRMHPMLWTSANGTAVILKLGPAKKGQWAKAFRMISPLSSPEKKPSTLLGPLFNIISERSIAEVAT